MQHKFGKPKFYTNQAGMKYEDRRQFLEQSTVDCNLNLPATPFLLSKAKCDTACHTPEIECL